LLAAESRIGIVAEYAATASDPTAALIVTTCPLTLVVTAAAPVPVIVPTLVVPRVAPFAELTVTVVDATAPEPCTAESETADADNAIVGVAGGETAATFRVTVMFCGVLLAVASMIGTVAV